MKILENTLQIALAHTKSMIKNIEKNEKGDLQLNFCYEKPKNFWQRLFRLSPRIEHKSFVKFKNNWYNLYSEDKKELSSDYVNFLEDVLKKIETEKNDVKTRYSNYVPSTTLDILE